MNFKKLAICFVFIVYATVMIIPVWAEEPPSPAPASEPETPPEAQPLDQPAEPGVSVPAGAEQAFPALDIAWPAAFIPEPEFEFDPVVDGATVVHDFIIQNQGTVPLIIKDIRTGCACAVAEYPPAIFPESEGKIKITIDTNGYGGRDFERIIMISTNEQMNSMLKVRIAGRINDFAHFDPKKVIILRGKPDDRIKQAVTITPDEKYPFSITGYTLDDVLKDMVTIHLEKKEDKYILTAENTIKKPVRYMGKLHLQTDSTYKPELNMIIRGIIE